MKHLGFSAIYVRHVARLLLLLFLNCESGFGSDFVVTFTLSPETQKDKRVVVSGKTNLPPRTTVTISLNDAVVGDNYGFEKCSISSDGTVLTGLMGPREGLKEGIYLIIASMSIRDNQSKLVTNVIGEEGEHLKGPLVKRVANETVVSVDEEFQIGPANAEFLQIVRLNNELEEFEALREEIADRYSDAQSHLWMLDEPTNLDVQSKWGQFSRRFYADGSRTEERIDKTTHDYGKRILLLLLADLESTLSSAISKSVLPKMDAHYQQCKARYAESLARVDEYILEREKKLNSWIAAKNKQLQKFRQWVDVSGNFRVEARLLSVSDGLVVLEKRSGKQITVPLAKFSRHDLEYLGVLRP